MANDALNTYLNDHLAGSVTAIAMLDHLIESSKSAEIKGTLHRLRDEIAEDQQTLEDVLARVGGRKSALRQVGGWLAERMNRLKLMVDDPVKGTLARLESLEMLTLGILGKRALWRSLTAVVPGRRELEGIDFDRLISRAEQQHDRAEAMRLDSARRVLCDGNA